MDPKTIKILLVGDAGVGKTAFIERWISGNFFRNRNYVSDGQSVMRNQILVRMNKGSIVLDIQNTCNYKASFQPDTQVAIVMFDTTNRKTYENCRRWISTIREKFGSIPIILCGNKCDIRDIRDIRDFSEYKELVVHPKDIRLHIEEKCLAYYDVSVKSTYNYEKPFLTAIRSIFGPDTCFSLNER